MAGCRVRQRVLVLLGIAFLAGVITAISPCVLPVLPILLAGSASTDRRRQRVAWVLERPFLFLTRRRVVQDSNGFVVGLSAGLVFVPCAGPVLAAVTALAASGEVTLRIVFVTGAYAIGAAIPMLGPPASASVGTTRATTASARAVRILLLSSVRPVFSRGELAPASNEPPR